MQSRACLRQRAHLSELSVPGAAAVERGLSPGEAPPALSRYTHAAQRSDERAHDAYGGATDPPGAEFRLCHAGVHRSGLLLLISDPAPNGRAGAGRASRACSVAAAKMGVWPRLGGSVRGLREARWRRGAVGGHGGRAAVCDGRRTADGTRQMADGTRGSAAGGGGHGGARRVA